MASRTYLPQPFLTHTHIRWPRMLTVLGGDYAVVGLLHVVALIMCVDFLFVPGFTG